MESTKYCTQCHEMRPLAAFGVDRYREDGLRFRCISCETKSENRRKYGTDERPDPEVVPDGQKRCSHCKVVAPLSEFHADHRRDDGIKPVCKQCVKDQRTRRLARLESSPRVIPMSKACITCRETKPIDEYSRSIDTTDGHFAYCKACDSRKHKATTARRKSPRHPVGITEKMCRRCGEVRPISWFRKDVSYLDGHVQYCRPCVHALEVPNAEAHTEARRRRGNDEMLARQRERRLFLAQYKAEKGCCDCGEHDPRCLDFDHIDKARKHGELAMFAARGAAWSRIMEELKLVAVRCANCHRKRHGSEYRWYQTWLETEASRSAG